jgi:hypothetical protein
MIRGQMRIVLGVSRLPGRGQQGCLHAYAPRHSGQIAQVRLQRQMHWGVVHPMHKQQQPKKAHPPTPEKGAASAGPLFVLHHQALLVGQY